MGFASFYVARNENCTRFPNVGLKLKNCQKLIWARRSPRFGQCPNKRKGVFLGRLPLTCNPLVMTIKHLMTRRSFLSWQGKIISTPGSQWYRLSLSISLSMQPTHKSRDQYKKILHFLKTIRWNCFLYFQGGPKKLKWQKQDDAALFTAFVEKIRSESGNSYNLV